MCMRYEISFITLPVAGSTLNATRYFWKMNKLHLLFPAAVIMLLVSCDPSNGGGRGVSPAEYYAKAKVVREDVSAISHARPEETATSYYGEYSYDEKGREVLLARYEEDGTPAGKRVTEYDDTLSFTKTVKEFNSDGTVKNSYTYKYQDPDMKVLLSRTANFSGARTDYIFENGRVTCEKRYRTYVDGDDVLLAEWAITYEDSEYSTKVTRTNTYILEPASEQPAETTLYTYNKDHLLIRVDHSMPLNDYIEQHTYSGNKHIVYKATPGTDYLKEEQTTIYTLDGDCNYAWTPEIVCPYPPRPEDDYSDAVCSSDMEGLDVSVVQCYAPGWAIYFYYTVTNNTPASLSLHFMNSMDTVVSDERGKEMREIHPYGGNKLSLAAGESHLFSFYVYDPDFFNSDNLPPQTPVERISVMIPVHESSIYDPAIATLTFTNVKVYKE